jgi:hypothetical protein
VFGYLTYLVVRGFFAAKPLWILGGVVVLMFYGGILWGLLPRPGISFTGHLFGAVGGVLAAWYVHGREPATPISPPRRRPERSHWDRALRDPALARDVWRRLEPVHAVTYFAPEAARGADRSRVPRLLDGLLRGAGGSARCRRAGASCAPSSTTSRRRGSPSRCPRRGRSPDPTSPSTPPGRCPRRAAAGAGRTDADVEEAAELAATAARTAPVEGRPLFAATRPLPWPSDPIDVLWHGATLLREHRGDGHSPCSPPSRCRGARPTCCRKPAATCHGP